MGIYSFHWKGADALMQEKGFPVTEFKLTDYTSNDFFSNTRRGANIFHRHDYFEFLYMLKGKAHHFINNQNRDLSPGYFLLIRPNDIHIIDDSDDPTAVRRNLLISQPLFKEICDFCCDGLYEKILGQKDHLQIPLPSDIQVILEERLHRCDMMEDYNIRLHGIKSVVAIMLHLYNESLFFKRDYPEWISQILLLMQSQDVLGGGMPVLVEKSGFSHGYLCREIKKHTGKTPIQLLTDYRMVSAKALLKGTSLSVMDISQRLGYSSVSHFITKFKEYYNISPLQYRNI